MKFSVFQVSRKGGRLKNEDRMGYCYTRESGLFVLADGMGGHPEGEVAAQLALQTIAALYQREARPLLKDVKAFLHTAVMAAHQQVMLNQAQAKAHRQTELTQSAIAIEIAANKGQAEFAEAELSWGKAGTASNSTAKHVQQHVEGKRTLFSPSSFQTFGKKQWSLLGAEL